MKPVSPSQIKEFRDCPRKWYVNKIIGIKQPPTYATTRGTRLHALFEGWWSKQRRPHSPRIRAALESCSPHIAPDEVLCESALTPGLTVGGVALSGRHDLIRRSGSNVTVTDLKSTSNMRYAHTPVSLALDPQAIIYGYDALVRWPGAVLCVEFVYTQTRGPPKAKAVRWFPAATDIDAGMSDLASTIAEMQKTAILPENEVPQNTDACRKYGGCPYFNRCFPAPEKTVASWDIEDAVNVKPSLTLYVDCLVVKPEISAGTRMADYLAPILAEIAREAKVGDFRLVPFAGWKGKLGEKLRANPPKGVFNLQRMDEASSVALEVLSPMATSIVFGTR